MAKTKRTGLYEIEWQTVSIRSITIILCSISGAILFSIWWFWFRDTTQRLPRSSLIIQESAARFIDYEGKVEVKPKDEYVWKRASFKMDLHEGDRIKTSPDSSARVRFDDGTEITIQTDSIIVIRKPVKFGSSDQTPLVVVETGGSDISTERSSSSSSVSTERIRRARFAPGTTGTVEANQATGEHSASVREGHVVVTDTRGVTTQLGKYEQVKIGKDLSVTKQKLPRTPPLLSPPLGQLFEFTSSQALSIELKWRDIPNAHRYHVQISESPLFGKIEAEHLNLSKSSITLKIPKTHKKQYFWRVRSLDVDRNASPWSEAYQFVVYTPSASKPTESTDQTPPVLKISYMHPFLPYVQVEGKTEADAFLTLNGQVIDVREDGSFVYTYTLMHSGWNELKFVAEDPAGNKSSVTKRVEYR